MSPVIESAGTSHPYNPPGVGGAFTVTLINTPDGIQDGTRNSIALPRLVDVSCLTEAGEK